jgi:hypothetical protein
VKERLIGAKEIEVAISNSPNHSFNLQFVFMFVQFDYVGLIKSNFFNNAKKRGSKLHLIYNNQQHFFSFI